MTTIMLTDPYKAVEAAEWAVKNIGFKDWNIESKNLMTRNVQYFFKFKRKKDAVLFSLKWLS